jgi:CHRD domain
MRKTTLRRLALAALAALTGVLLAAATVSATEDGEKKSGKRQGKLLKANLSGAQEVPGPGDEDGRGMALIKVKPKAGELCFALRWRDIADPTAAHIHKGEKGVAGDIVVDLFGGTVSKSRCFDVADTELLRDIKRNPRAYYVNIHNAEFPAGAIRGQLKRTGHHRGQRPGGDKSDDDKSDDKDGDDGKRCDDDDREDEGKDGDV